MPLPQNLQTDFKKGWDDSIDLLGGTFTHKRSDNGFESDIVCAAVSPGIDDAPFVNEMGLEAQVIRAKATASLNKHDTLTRQATGKGYTIQAVHPVTVNDVQIGWRVWAT